MPTLEKALYLWVIWSDNNDQFDVGQLKVKVCEVFLRHFSFMLQAVPLLLPVPPPLAVYPINSIFFPYEEAHVDSLDHQ